LNIKQFKGIIIFVVIAMLFMVNSVLAVQEEVALKITSGDTVKTLTMEEIKEMPALEGWGGRMRSTGAIEGPFKLKGVPVIDLCELVGGINPDTAVKITSRDGYAMTFSYKQVMENDFITYDPVSQNEVPHEDLQMILAYQTDGNEMTFELGGPLRLAILSEKNQVTDGHWWSKWVEQIELVPAPKDWVLQLKGAINEDLDRATFESGAAEGCHGTKYVDDKGREWEGIPLWLLVGRVDDDNPHGDKAFNDSLVQDGYEVEIIAEDGFSATLPISSIARRNNIIVAYKLNGESLPEKYWPLRLAGEGLTGKEQVGQIKEIKVIFPE
jgi:DMSO/TMAO reductase YedYZ molybdopterin-dependent catalytic subunit